MGLYHLKIIIFVLLCILLYGCQGINQSIRNDEIKNSLLFVSADSIRNSYAAAFDDQILNVLYSVIPGIPGNTEAHFLDGIQRGFNGLKADIRITSDGGLVLCHDAGYTFDNSGRIILFDQQNYTPIRNLSLKEVLALDFAEKVDGEYIHPCSLDRFLELCKEYGVLPYITPRWDGDQNNTLPELYRVLRKYNLEHSSIINLFTGSSAWSRIIKDIDSTLLCCNTLRTDTSLTEQIIDDTSEWGCNYLCINYDCFSTITPSLIKYANSKRIRVWCYRIHTKEEYFKCVEAGLVGFQNYSRDAVPQ